MSFDILDWTNEFIKKSSIPLKRLRLIEELSPDAIKYIDKRMSFESLLDDDEIPVTAKTTIERAMFYNIKIAPSVIFTINSACIGVPMRNTMFLAAIKTLMNVVECKYCSYSWFIRSFTNIPSVSEFNTLWIMQKDKTKKEFSNNFLDYC